MVVAQRQPLEIGQFRELVGKVRQLVRVQHEHAQVGQLTNGGRDADHVTAEARLPLRTQVQYLCGDVRLLRRYVVLMTWCQNFSDIKKNTDDTD